MIGGEVSITILVFILDYFQEKQLMTKYFKKSKKLYFETILGTFCPNLCKMNFLGKKGSTYLKYSTYLPYLKTQKKKLISYFQEKCRTERTTDKETDRQANNGDFIGPSVGRGPNKWKVEVLLQEEYLTPGL